MKIFFTILFFISSLTIFSQKIEIGANLAYNIQTESFGYGLLINKNINNIVISPLLLYYPKNNFNKINEYIIGIDFKYIFYHFSNKEIYALTGFAYNAWINNKESYLLDAKYNNWNADLGFGIKYDTCISPFAEIRYNVRWQEFTFKMGVLYNFNCKHKKKYKIRKLPNKKEQGSEIECPKF
jgi:hypothetical protein